MPAHLFSSQVLHLEVGFNFNIKDEEMLKHFLSLTLFCLVIVATASTDSEKKSHEETMRYELSKKTFNNVITNEIGQSENGYLVESFIFNDLTYNLFYVDKQFSLKDLNGNELMKFFPKEFLNDNKKSKIRYCILDSMRVAVLVGNSSYYCILDIKAKSIEKRQLNNEIKAITNRNPVSKGGMIFFLGMDDQSKYLGRIDLSTNQLTKLKVNVEKNSSYFSLCNGPGEMLILCEIERTSSNEDDAKYYLVDNDGNISSYVLLNNLYENIKKVSGYELSIIFTEFYGDDMCFCAMNTSDSLYAFFKININDVSFKKMYEKNKIVYEFSSNEDCCIALVGRSPYPNNPTREMVQFLK
jgi:hypothetical protein